MNFKLKLRKKILYKVEGSEKIGMGHVFRSFFLIQKLKQKYDVIVFTESKSKSEEFFLYKKLTVISYTRKNKFKTFKNCMLNYKVFKFINDSILFDKKIYTYLKKNNYKCFFLDTQNLRATKQIYCINTFIETKQNHKNYLSNLKYVITDPSLKPKKNYNLDKNIRLLLHFGGTDDRMLNIKIINILPKIENLEKVSIILGPALKYKRSIIFKNIKKIKNNIQVYNYPKKLNSIYNASNFAITTGGNTLFNFCSMNMRNISISANNLEKKNCKKMKKYNLTNYYGHYSEFKKKNFIDFFNKAILKKDIIKKKLLFDGVNEINKVINKM